MIPPSKGKTKPSNRPTDRAPWMGEYVRVGTCGDIWIVSGNQSFRVSTKDFDDIKLNWYRDMLCIALDRMTKSEVKRRYKDFNKSNPPIRMGTMQYRNSMGANPDDDDDDIYFRCRINGQTSRIVMCTISVKKLTGSMPSSTFLWKRIQNEFR